MAWFGRGGRSDSRFDQPITPIPLYLLRTPANICYSNQWAI
ncbi:hypothetical protein MJO28_012782 [Puccinia striiformis f. sp. tritici]|uniref:Uncharacterized protein n=1 Tax=Puccinia striiformis f. sp. tritici TaxID=168172 RepID=A0ACC0DZC8_9BASI|nr:hypothetical protein MJO28_012782 [Puccinia striiformis f. sp. tritici]